MGVRMVVDYLMDQGTKIYLCTAIELVTRAAVGYEIALNCEASVVTETIHQFTIEKNSF